MINIDDILLLIQSITILLDSFVPGAVFCIMILFFSHKKIEFSAGFILVSLIMSKLLSNFCSLVYPFHSQLFITGWTIIISAVLGVFAYLVFRSKWFRHTFRRMFRQTVGNDIWQDVIDMDGTHICVIVENTSYYGDILYKEMGDKTRIALSGYVVVKDGVEMPKSNRQPSIIVLDLNKANYVEVYYQWGSEQYKP